MPGHFIEKFMGRTQQPQPQVPEELATYLNGQQIGHNEPWGHTLQMTPSSTTGFLYGGGQTIELDVTPLNRFISNLFPFVIETSYLKVNQLKYSDGRDKLEYPKIKFIVSPAHRAELYDEDIEDKVKSYIRGKLRPLLVSMYEISEGFNLEIHFGSKRSETILEHLKEE